MAQLLIIHVCVCENSTQGIMMKALFTAIIITSLSFSFLSSSVAQIKYQRNTLNASSVSEGEVDTHNIEALEMQANSKIKQFSGQLKTALVGAIQTEGFASAVKVCKEQAPEIAKSVSKDGWTLARTSLKTRNAANKPDAWEQEKLQDFDKKFKEGVSPNQLSAIDVNENRFRYMKAIPTGQVCLACHGSNVEPSLKATIDKNYPNDKAIGYTLEDIRGAFTLRKSL